MDGDRPDIAPRPPGEVMRLARLGSFHPTRLSFMRILLRRAEADGWKVDRTLWDIDTRGVGRAVYRVRTPDRTYSLVAFAHDLPDELRSDRVIAEAWDATFALMDGEPSEADLERLERNVPKQEAGRMSGREMTLSRANRSVRLFSHVVDALASGRQPDVEEIDAVGYLMRTTAVYGSAKFGLSDRETICTRPELAPPFQAEMLTVWLIRAFTVDIAEHIAHAASPGAVRLDPVLKRRLGVGNSTGLGMAPFLISHPVLIHKWMNARETALARVRSTALSEETRAAFTRALAHATENAALWQSAHPLQQAKLADLGRDLEKIANRGASLDEDSDWDSIWCWGERELTLEGQEALLALLLEPHGDVVDDLCADMAADESAAFPIDPQVPVGRLLEWLERTYSWALQTDWSSAEARARLWYVSAEKLEPRLAERSEESLDLYEQPLGPGFDAVVLHEALSNEETDTRTGSFLGRCPNQRRAVRRLQIVAAHPYAEIADNTLGGRMLPIDLLRAKLSFFGATRFDPRSDRWVRISMFQGALFPEDLGVEPADSWMYGE